MPGRPLIDVENLTKVYKSRNALGLTTSEVTAVDGISFTLREGECFALVGESGCGKSTTGRMLQKLIAPTSGRIDYRGRSVADLRGGEERGFRSAVQMIYQDPYSSLNPRKRIGAILAESLRIAGVRSGAEIKERVHDSLEAVGFSTEHATRYPHEFSGGQRQRIGIARALTVNPQILLCDEPVSALDVSIQAQILNLLQRLQAERGLTYLFISHDLSVVRHIADRVAVMHRGQIVEEGPTAQIFTDPQHEYTRTLLDSVPTRRPGHRRARRNERATPAA
ncbi:ABC transporter ATP-binding protein [Bogoriella caseilytica]|uniref:Oligopeptide transport system ATP-binding protein n=1 Tax=Bogoriella caseilytica TaxID=56055 RepID=A0A3N2BDP6_9MICO|nr:ATP-binding cassette domain-containing protein [Bogoriella caseilytica]ROR73377.1 oligopeptide transport system ATP-binding protein [Bogoriella caseilytica]